MAADATNCTLRWRNVYKPKQASKIEARRTAILHQEALQHASVGDGFFERLDKAGIMDERLREVAHELYQLEGLVPPEKPPGLSDTIQAARYRDRLLKFTENAHTRAATTVPVGPPMRASRP